MNCFDIRDFGAVGDGTVRCTESIQKAIDTCASGGGGQVLISGGRFMSGTLRLRSGVDLHLASDGVLLGSPDCADFPEREDDRHVIHELLPRFRNACFLFAEEESDFSITGPGTIDCSGDRFVTLNEKLKKGWRYQRIDAPTPPRVVFLTGCRNVTIEGITMTNQPAGWSFWIHDCDDVTVDRIKIHAEVQYPNNDGIHINCSRNVTVSNSAITCGDDCIIVRANNVSLHGENRICERVTVTNCTLTSWSAGIRIGWICDGTIRDCTFSNLVMTDCSVGISVLLPGRAPGDRISDEGREYTRIENLSFSNIVMDRGNSHAILIHVEDNPATHVEAVRNLFFHGIHAVSCALPHLYGRKDVPLENIRFYDCTFERRGTFQPLHGADNRLKAFSPDYTGFMEVRYVKNLVFSNTSFDMEDCFEQAPV